MVALALAMAGSAAGQGVPQRPLIPCSVDINQQSATRGVPWTDGIVPYTFHVNVTSAMASAVLAAMAVIENEATIRFVPDAGSANSLLIQDATSNSSSVGMIGGPQTLSIYNWNARFTMVHELMHALGFVHEHQRPDRDAYITVNWTNLQPGQTGLFTKLQGKPPTTPYDFDSVMHFDARAFGNGGSPTISVLAPNQAWQSRIGQSDHLSLGDVSGLRELYGNGNFTTMQGWSTFHVGTVGSFWTGDFDGDRRTDLMRYVGGTGIQMLLSTGTSFAPAVTWSGSGIGSGNEFWTGDFDDDGKDDVMRYLSGTGIQVMLSTGSSLGSRTTWSGHGSGTVGFHVGDFDGDGKDDVLRHLNGTGLQVLLSTGSSFAGAVTWSPAGPGTIPELWIGDFNGDGRDDVMRCSTGGGPEVLLSNGNGFGPPAPWSREGVGSIPDWWIGDFDGDGNDDVMRYVGGSGMEVMLSNRTAFDTHAKWASSTIGTVADFWVGDYDGNGRSDIARYVDSSNPLRIHVSLSRDRVANPAFPGFGSGCPLPDGSTPSIAMSGSSLLGGTVLCGVRSSMPSSWVLTLGSSTLTWNGQVLPLSLAALGASRCDLLVSIDMVLGVPSSTTPFPLLLPNNPWLLGRPLFAQALLGPDPRFNALGIVATAAAEIRVR